jgi:hypothetical protein
MIITLDANRALADRNIQLAANLRAANATRLNTELRQILRQRSKRHRVRRIPVNGRRLR